MQTKKFETGVGAFLIIALAAIVFLCLKVANVTSLRSEPTYRVYATFDNIGSLKTRFSIAPWWRGDWPC